MGWIAAIIIFLLIVSASQSEARLDVLEQQVIELQQVIETR